MSPYSIRMTLLALTVGFSSSCSPHAPMKRTSPPGAVGDFASEGVIEAENFNSLEDMLRKADRVVVGKIIRVTLGPQESEFQTGRVFIAERVTNATVEVAFVLSVPDAAKEVLEQLKDALPKTDAVWLLRSLATWYSGVYRPINQAAIVEASPDGTSQPSFYRESAETARKGNRPADHGDFISELTKVRFDELANRVSKPRS
jgi:hypothetical protein